MLSLGFIWVRSAAPEFGSCSRHRAYLGRLLPIPSLQGFPVLFGEFGSRCALRVARSGSYGNTALFAYQCPESDEKHATAHAMPCDWRRHRFLGAMGCFNEAMLAASLSTRNSCYCKKPSKKIPFSDLLKMDPALQKDLKAGKGTGTAKKGRACPELWLCESGHVRICDAELGSSPTWSAEVRGRMWAGKFLLRPRATAASSRVPCSQYLAQSIREVRWKSHDSAVRILNPSCKPLDGP